MLLICEFISFPALIGITSVCDDLSEYMRSDKHLVCVGKI